MRRTRIVRVGHSSDKEEKTPGVVACVFDGDHKILAMIILQLMDEQIRTGSAEVYRGVQ